MGKTPLVSIIIPTYNQAHFIGETLKSVLAQTMPDWEAIVINNNSDDNTIEVVNSFHDPRIKLISFRNNGIIAASRNEGMRHAKGRYIAFLDSDDYWHPKKLEKQLAVFNQYPQLNLVATNLTVIPSGPQILYKKHLNKILSFNHIILRKCFIATSSALMKRGLFDTLGGMDENPQIVATEDHDYWLKLLRYQNNAAFLMKEPLTYYRQHQQNTSNTTLQGSRGIQEYKKLLLIYQKHTDFAPKQTAQMIHRMQKILMIQKQAELDIINGTMSLWSFLWNPSFSLYIKLKIFVKYYLGRI